MGVDLPSNIFPRACGSSVTDNAGYYRLQNLPPVTVMLTAELPGFATFKREGILMRAGSTFTIDIELKVGALEETVTVAGESPMVSTGIPTKTLVQEIEFVDHSIGLMVAELTKQNLLNSTLIVISAKHGQSPIDPHRVLRIDGDVKSIGKSPATILASFLPDSEVNQIGPTEDDVSLLWLSDPSRSNVKSAVYGVDRRKV